LLYVFIAAVLVVAAVAGAGMALWRRQQQQINDVVGRDDVNSINTVSMFMNPLHSGFGETSDDFEEPVVASSAIKLDADMYVKNGAAAGAMTENKADYDTVEYSTTALYAEVSDRESGRAMTPVHQAEGANETDAADASAYELFQASGVAQYRRTHDEPS